MLVVVLLILAFLLGLFASAGRMIFLWLRHIYAGINPYVFGILYSLILVFILAAFIVSRTPESGIPRGVFRLAHYALGVLLYTIMIVNFIALLMFLGRLLHLIPVPVPKTISLVTGGLCLALVIFFTGYGSINATRLKTRLYKVQLGHAQEEMDSLTIALVSDLHLGYVVEERHLARVIAAVNEVKPDLVCLAGDIFDGDITSLANPKVLQEMLRGLEARYGVYACLGNHDAGRDYEQMLAFLAGAAVQVLEDKAAVIDDRILLVGRKDSSPIGRQGDERAALASILTNNALPVIVMDHQPGNIGEYGAETDLVLSGHSHQGQMFPFNLITKAVYVVDHGYYTDALTGAQFIVTSGAGTWGPPLRVGSVNEIVAIQVLFPKLDAAGRE